MSSGTKPDHSSSSLNLTCKLCNTSWPSHLTVRHEGHVLCCPCHAKLKEEAFAKEAERKLSQHRTTGSNAQGVMLTMTIVIAAAAIAVAALGVYFLVDWAKKQKKPEVAPEQQAAPLPPAVEVDSSLLASHLTLKSKAVVDDIAFLVRGPHGIRAVVSAAKFHQAVAASKPPVPAGMPAVSLIEKWTLDMVLPGLKVLDLSPTTSTLAVTELSDNPVIGGGDRKIWQLKLKESEESTLPVIVLNPQPTVSEVGQRIHLLYLKPKGEKQVQATQPGRVDSTYLMGTRLAIKLAEKMSADKIIGCPVVNDQGQFVGTASELGDQPDAQGKVEFVVVMSSFDLFGTTPPKSKDAKSPPSATTPARK